MIANGSEQSVNVLADSSNGGVRFELIALTEAKYNNVDVTVDISKKNIDVFLRRTCGEATLCFGDPSDEIRV